MTTTADTIMALAEAYADTWGTPDALRTAPSPQEKQT